MQKGIIVSDAGVDRIINYLFEDNPVVSEAYSEYGKKIVYFSNASELIKYVSDAKANNKLFLNLSVYFPETNGFVEEEKIKLDPKHCEGYKFRYCVRGWGVIQFQLDFKKFPSIECRFAVNTEKRANAWSENYPQLQSPSLWDWNLVEKRARRLIYNAQKYA